MVEMNFSVGDKVRFRLALKEMDGVVLESPDSSVVLLKLDNGYNIGINKENVLGYKVIKKFREEERKEFKVEKKEALPSIGLIVTGGTIASKVDYIVGGVKPITDANEFLSYYPELFAITNIKRMDVPFKVFSENMTYENWIKIAEIAKEMLDDNEIKGVIITHGTDTLHYTSAALSFFLGKLNKPVVLTYSQRSVDRASSDARMNLECAVRMALSDCAEVMIVGHGTINDNYCFALKGNKAKKMHSSRRDAFKPVNSEPIAKVFPDGKIEFLYSYNKRDDKKKVQIDASYTDKVALVKFYPGQSPDILDYYALKYKGIVVEATGLGQVNETWIPSLKKHIKNGLVVCIASQTTYGRVDSYVYSTAREMENAGCIFLEDVLAETALVKLGWVLGHYGWKSRVKEKMIENIAGELSEKLEL